MDNEQKQKRQSIIIVTLLCACLFGLAVAYAALSATLDITFGTLTQNALTWNVGFQTGTVNGTKTGTASTVCGAATVTSDTVSVASTTLTTLHDKCVYPLTILNTGSIDALLSTISAKTPTSFSCDTTTTSQMVCGNITYKLTTDSAGQALLTTNNVLAKTSGTLNAYLIVEYTGTLTGSDGVQTNGGFTLNYIQN